MNKKITLSTSYLLILSYFSGAHFDAQLLNYQPGSRENVVVYFPVPYSSGYFSLYRDEPTENKNVAVITHGYFGDTLSRSVKNMLTETFIHKDSFFRKFISDETNPYYFYLPLLNHLFRLYAQDLKKPDGTPRYDMILGYAYSSVGRIKELGQRMSDTLTPITSNAHRVVHNAYSMGGLSALWALTKTGPEGLGQKGKNQTLITYSSPLQGIATGFSSNSLISHLQGDISITDMATMTPFPDDPERSDFLKELNDGSQGFEIGPNVFFDEILDGYCISGSRHANLSKIPAIGEESQDATYSIGDWIQDLKAAVNSENFLYKLKGIMNTRKKFNRSTTAGLNIQKISDYLNRNYWKSDQWDELSEAEENYFSNKPVSNISNKRMGRLLSDGMVPVYSGVSFPKLWYPEGNSYGVYSNRKYKILEKGKKFEDMTQQERALYIDAMGQKSRSFRENRVNHTFVLPLNHQTILGSHHHWDGNYQQPEIQTALDQGGNTYFIEDPQWLLYQTLYNIHEQMDVK